MHSSEGMRTVTTSIERRAKVRFPLRRELRYKVLEGDAIVAVGNGNTWDMSSGGVAFRPDGPVSLGAFIELSISWPVLLDNGCPMRLIAFGKVVRAGLHRFACTVEFYEFRTQARTLQFSAPGRVDGTLRRWAREYTKAQRATA
jgi:hypothetical protein